MSALSAADIRHLFELLNTELEKADTIGELYLVGGAVMCLAFNARPSKQDVDAIFQPAPQVRAAAARVAALARINPHWLNDSVKAYLSAQGDFASFLELSHLRVMVAEPHYLLTMKCLAMRLGAEFHDEDDIHFLLRLLDVRTYKQTVEIIGRYYLLEHVPHKTLYALEELLPRSRGWEP